MKTKVLILCCAVLLAMSAPAFAAGGGFGVSLLGGWAWPTASDALSGRDGDSGPASSSLESTWTLGAEAAWQHASGFSFGVGVQYWKMVADAARSGNSETEFISMKTTPVYAVVRYTHPVEAGFSGHAEAGLGYAFTSGGKESGIHAMESGIGQTVDIDTDNGICAFLGAGVDYFFRPELSLGVGLRYWWMEVDYDLTTAGLGNIDKGVFNADNLQAIVSLTYWFGK